MKNSAATIEVRLEGQKPRLFRFEKMPVRIGFAGDCDLSLESPSEKGAELILDAKGDETFVIRPSSNPGAFQLNGVPCVAETTVKSRDVITSESYRITVRELPGEEGISERRDARLGEDQPSLATVAAIDSEQNDDTQYKPAAGEAAPAVPKEQAPVGTGAMATPRAEQPGVAARKKPGLSYLSLFFAPVQEFLVDDDVAEVMINGPRQVYIERKGRLAAVPVRFASEQALQAAVMNVARSVGRFFDKDNPRLDARLPDGSRLHAVMPPISRAGTTVAIRKFRREKLTLSQLIEFGSISSDGARLLEIVVKSGKNLIVSGATSSGKTSVLNVLSALIPENDRILVLEDASELQLQQAHAVCFETRKPDEHGKGEVAIRDLLHSALRLRPDRLVVGEIRGGEALDLLQAMNTGHEGSMSTIHANSARDSLLRMETCALLSGIEIPLSALREQVASAIHVVIQTARLFDGSRKITGITEVLGLKEGQYQLQDILVFEQENMTADGNIKGKHVFTENHPTFLSAAIQRGLDVKGIWST